MGKNFVTRLHLAVGLWLAGYTMVAQGVAYSQQIWLQESTFNPAASGLFSKYDGYAGYSNLPAFTDKFDEDGYWAEKAFGGNINFFLPNLNSGFGLSFNKRSNVEWLGLGWWLPADTISQDFENFRLNYNYQFTLKNEAVLSIGAAFVGQKRNWENRPEYCYSCDIPTIGSIRLTGVGLGAVYAAPKWSAGFSISPVFAFINETYQYIYYTTEYTVHGSYNFDGGKNTTLTPYVYASMTSDHTGFYLPFATLGFRIEHEWFLFAFDVSGSEYGYVNGTLGVVLWKQLSLIYTGSAVGTESSSSKGRHTFGLRYALKK